jgi:hypothetical protein
MKAYLADAAEPGVSEAAAKGQLTAVGKNMSKPLEEVRTYLDNISQPVLYATGIRDVMTLAVISYTAAAHTEGAAR